jgi:hypothetical protein
MLDIPGVPLAYYLQHHPACAVRFYCAGCHASHEESVMHVVERLKAQRLGDERTGVRAVARFADEPCARCGARRWETRPSWPMR